MVITAEREVREETGLRVECAQNKLKTIEYWFSRDSVRVHKFVHFWLMTAVGGSLDDHDNEFDTVEWLTLEAAMDLLSYESERNVLEAARAILANES